MLVSVAHPDEKRYQRIEFGAKYCSVMLAGGQSGVCATLGVPPPPVIPERFNSDFSTPQGRIIALATANALLNGLVPLTRGDIVGDIVTGNWKRVTMIGLFRPLVDPVLQAGLELTIFDLDESHPNVRPAADMPRVLANTPLLVLTATSLGNGTFGELMNLVAPDTAVWMLGPSAPLSPWLMKKYPVERIYGTLFPKGCGELHDLIGAGAGTRQFNHLGEKVSLLQSCAH